MEGQHYIEWFHLSKAKRLYHKKDNDNEQYRTSGDGIYYPCKGSPVQGDATAVLITTEVDPGKYKIRQD